MRAAVYHGRRDLRIDEVSAPGPVGRQQVLVKPLFCGICGTDVHEYAEGPIISLREPHPFTGACLPQILGHEFAAKIVDVGADVTRVQVGDIVSIQPLVMPMDDYYSRRGLHNMSPNMATIGLQTEWGGMAEFALVNEYNVFQLPEGMDPRLGALIEPSAVALNGAERAGVTAGDAVLVTGGGPIGALVAMACAALGATRIFVSEPNAGRRRQIESFGIGVVTIDPLKEDPVQIVRAATEDGVGADACVECSGVEVGLNTCIEAVRPQGTISQVGIHAKPVSANPLIWAEKSITIRGAWGFPITSWPRILRMVDAGTYPVGKIITREIKFADIVQDGFEALCNPEHDDMKVLVKI